MAGRSRVHSREQEIILEADADGEGEGGTAGQRKQGKAETEPGKDVKSSSGVFAFLS